MEGADLFCKLVIDSPVLAVAFDQLLDGWLLVVCEDQGGLVAAEAVDGDLAEGAAFDRDRVLVVGDVAVLVGAVKPVWSMRLREALRAW